MTRPPQQETTLPHKDTIHEPSLGETIDGFHLVEVISDRMFTTLYRVEHPNHTLPMIMKVPKLGISVPPSAFTEFETEVRILSRLHGVYTPKVIAKGDFASCLYLVMEFIEGDHLYQAVKQAPVSVQQLTELMIPVCKAVHELHRHNIIHLDLKPSNIRNRADGQVVILDFGSAHHTHIPDLFESPHQHIPRTFAYVAPEQLEHVRTDSRSDIYALGVILFQLATGLFPFGKGDTLINERKRLYLPPTPPRAINEAIPPWLQEIIMTCLQRRADDRFASAKQVAYALANPNIVPLSHLAELTKRPGIIQIVQSWWQSRQDHYRQATHHPHERIKDALHVLVALDIDHSSEQLQQALRNTIRRLAHSEKSCYFTVISVLEHSDLHDQQEDPSEILKTEHPSHVHRQIELRHWMKKLKIANSHINYQVLEGHIAETIVHYAKQHVIDQIIIGARGSSTMRRFMGSVSSKVVAEAPCSVTVVRTRCDNTDTVLDQVKT